MYLNGKKAIASNVIYDGFSNNSLSTPKTYPKPSTSSSVDFISNLKKTITQNSYQLSGDGSVSVKFTKSVPFDLFPFTGKEKITS